MNKRKRQCIIGFLFLIISLALFGCEEQYPQADLSTGEVISITEASAICNGKILSDGGTDITSYGICWNTISNPTIDNSKTINNNGAKEFSDSITGLKAGTTYYVRAYAINKGGVAYGSEKIFSTNGLSVNTLMPTNILAHSAQIGGSIETDGTGFSIISRGICYSKNPLPTKINDTISIGVGKGSFIVSLANLESATIYYVRAYATNKSGTYYGDVKQFATTDGLAKLTTISVTDITNTSALLGGDITDDGGSPVTERGVIWNTTQNITLNLSTKISNSNGIGSFTNSIAKLTAGVTYYVCAYATNNDGTAYGNLISFTTNGMTDIDGNVYNTITIGTQVWTVENLKTTRYNNGDLIGTTVPATLDISKENSPKYQWAPNGDESLVGVFGRLYSWYVVDDSRGICPKGWHVSTHNDWTKLKDYVKANLGYSSSIGKALAAKTCWASCPTKDAVGNDLSANNSSGFSALPTGYRNFSLSFNGYEQYTWFWHADGSFQPLTTNNANDLGLYGMTSNSNGLSVRCVRDY